MATTGKVRENRLRRMAHRQGYELRKSRRRDHMARDFGTYGIVDPELNAWVASERDGFGLSLDQIEAWLTREPK